MRTSPDVRSNSKLVASVDSKNRGENPPVRNPRQGRPWLCARERIEWDKVETTGEMFGPGDLSV